MSDVVKLSELSPGITAVVSAVAPGDGVGVRLREMGVLPGTRVSFVRSAPLGDPLEFKVRGYRLTLRRNEADLVTVLPAAG
jgi:ferrous iron transport protein A